MKKETAKKEPAKAAKPAEKPVEIPAQEFNYMESGIGRYLSPWMMGVLYAAACHERFGTAQTRKALDDAIG